MNAIKPYRILDHELEKITRLTRLPNDFKNKIQFLEEGNLNLLQRIKDFQGALEFSVDDDEALEFDSSKEI